MNLATPQHVGSSRTRDPAGVSCIGNCVQFFTTESPGKPCRTFFFFLDGLIHSTFEVIFRKRPKEKRKRPTPTLSESQKSRSGLSSLLLISGLSLRKAKLMKTGSSQNYLFSQSLSSYKVFLIYCMVRRLPRDQVP